MSSLTPTTQGAIHSVSGELPRAAASWHALREGLHDIQRCLKASVAHLVALLQGLEGMVSV